MSTSPPNGESAAHRELKRLALLWSQTNGYRIAAAEVSLPNHRVRMDVAAYRSQKVRVSARDERLKTTRLVWNPAVGATAIFECKASRPDFRRDARSIRATIERLEFLYTKRLNAEQELKIHYPSIRNGDALFQEYETLNFHRPGYERYEAIIAEIQGLTERLHRHTKFERLAKHAAANLFYVVAEPNLVEPATLPCGWGLLEKEGAELALKIKPHWHEVPEAARFAFLERISLAATRCVNREHGLVFQDPRMPEPASPPSGRVDDSA